MVLLGIFAPQKLSKARNQSFFTLRTEKKKKEVMIPSPNMYCIHKFFQRDLLGIS